MIEKEGLKRKYLIFKTDGTPIQNDAFYFVLNADSKDKFHKKASLKAINEYADSIKLINPILSKDLKRQIRKSKHEIRKHSIIYI